MSIKLVSSSLKLISVPLVSALAILASCSRPELRQSLGEPNMDRAVAADEALPRWAYDAGPDPKTPMGKELIDLNASIPDYPGISVALTGDQKFRPVYGPIPWRMQQRPNSVKILFIGQDGTHIAEAAGRPATAGFGGRAQDLARYFGVGSSAAFINAYAFTIKGQYGTFETPFVRTGPDGRDSLQFGPFVDNPLWLMSNDLDSPIVKWRNDLISWIIRNNRDSLKMIVLFGGAARDTAAAFIESRGGKVGTRYSVEDMASIQVPETEQTGAGGNNVASFPVAADGRDVYSYVLNRRVNYMMPREEKKSADLAAAQRGLQNNFNRWRNRLVFSKGGPYKNGIVHPGQLGGYDIDRKMEINGRQTISLKGLRVSNDLTIKHDVLVVQLPHPTSLSMMKPEQASRQVAEDLEGFKPYVAAGWSIDPDPGFTNDFAAGKPYRYGRAGMGPEYYDFGAPASRMVDVSSAVRDGENVIIFGTREKGGFDSGAVKAQIRAMTEARPSKMPSSQEMWTARPRSLSTRYVFDPGPPEKYARLMKENLPADVIKAHDVNEDFAHYRGTFNKPRVLVMADPDGWDDLITARALTGSRGQYLHGLMEDLGVNDKYLVIKTAPFGWLNAGDWNWVMSKTNRYREELLTAILADSKPELIIADGQSASGELHRILGNRAPAPIITIQRVWGRPEAGIAEAGAQIAAAVAAFRNVRPHVRMSDIPRSHLSYYARIWEGTSGDRVITSPDPRFMGKAFAVVAPRWAYSQRLPLSPGDQAGVEKLIRKLEDGGLRKGGEPVPKFLNRVPQSSLGRSKRDWLAA